MSDVKTTSSTAPYALGVSSDLGKTNVEPFGEGRSFARASASASMPISAPAASSRQEVKHTKKGPAPGKKQAEENIYRDFRRLMDAVVEELDKAPDYLEDGVLTDEGSAVTAEVDQLLSRVAECPWGERESLKLAVTVLRIPTRNARWTQDHVRFLQETARLFAFST